MVVRRIVRWSIIIVILFAVFPAVAQTNSSAPGAGSGGKLRAACGEDLQRFCAGVPPGGGRLVQCLSSHAGELLAACGDMVTAASRGGAKLREACGEDLQRFCAAVQPGGRRLVQCLTSHTGELSAACGNTIAATKSRRDSSNPSPQSPATQPVAPVTVGNSPVAIGSILRASCGPKALCWGAKGRRGIEVPGVSAHETINNLQLVFPEIRHAADRPG